MPSTLQVHNINWVELIRTQNWILICISDTSEDKKRQCKNDYWRVQHRTKNQPSFFQPKDELLVWCTKKLHQSFYIYNLLIVRVRKPAISAEKGRLKKWQCKWITNIVRGSIMFIKDTAECQVLIWIKDSKEETLGTMIMREFSIMCTVWTTWKDT